MLIKMIFIQNRLAEIQQQKMWIEERKAEVEELHLVHENWVKEKQIVEAEVSRLRDLNRSLRYKVAHPNNKPEPNTLMVKLNTSLAVRSELKYILGRGGGLNFYIFLSTKQIKIDVKG